MILHLTKSKLFTVDPAIRFSREYGVKPRLWNELWKRYGLYEHDIPALCGYFEYKTGRKPNPKSIARWIFLTEIYCRANHVLRMGVRVVDSKYFGTFENELVREISKNMRFSGKTDSRTIV